MMSIASIRRKAQAHRLELEAGAEPGAATRVQPVSKKKIKEIQKLPKVPEPSGPV